MALVMSRTEMVRKFHREAGLKMGLEPLTTADLELRAKVIAEEAKELIDALAQLILDVAQGVGVTPQNMSDVVKELCDLLYVAEGLAVELGSGYIQGINVDEAFKRVHESNMSKLPAIHREDGKVLKGPNYKAPDLKDLVQ